MWGASSWLPGSLSLQTLKDSAAELSVNTNRAVAAGLEYTVGATKRGLVATGVAEAAQAALERADRAVEASGVVGLTRAAVASTGRALDAAAAAAERTGAADAAARAAALSASALAPAAAVSARAFKGSVGATVAAADATLKVVKRLDKAAETLLPNTVTGLKKEFEELKELHKELSHESNERMLAALYPNWTGDDSGCAALLGAYEAAWAATSTRLAAAAEAALAAEAAAARAAGAANARRDAWRPLEAEIERLPGLADALNRCRAVAARCADLADAAALALDGAEAAAAAGALRARAAAAVRAAAVQEEAHTAALAGLQVTQPAWLAPAPPGMLPSRLRVGPAVVDARRLAAVEPELGGADASLKTFLSGIEAERGAAAAATAADGGAKGAKPRRRRRRSAEGSYHGSYHGNLAAADDGDWLDDPPPPTVEVAVPMASPLGGETPERDSASEDAGSDY